MNAINTTLIFLVSPGPSFQDDNVYYQFTVEDMKNCKLMNVVETSDSDSNNNCSKNNKQNAKPTPSDDETQKKNIANFYDDMAKLQISKSKGLCST